MLVTRLEILSDLSTGTAVFRAVMLQRASFCLNQLKQLTLKEASSHDCDGGDNIVVAT